MTALMSDAIKQQDFVKLASQIPYAQPIGIHCMPIGEHFIFKLPKHEEKLKEVRPHIVHMFLSLHHVRPDSVDFYYTLIV